MPHVLTDIVRATMALWIILDPIGLLPVVMALTAGQDPRERQAMLYKSGVVAFLLLLVLTFTAKSVFKLYGIEDADFQIGGGIILFGIALHTINQRHWDEGFSGHGLGIVPIACPLLIGPGAILASLLMLNNNSIAVTLISITAAFALVLLVFRFTNALYRMLGETGAGVVARLMGILLAAIAVQFIRKGMVHILGGMKWPIH